ncbi:MAG TPA: Gfo/Idh/MocA family oxidoreductase [Pelolinea sp.]|nr:Gfo/Idh/MocA family oxidoreductase [Pelolinea sp.]
MGDKQIRVGVIGLGFIGKVHAQAYSALPQLYGRDALNVKLSAVLRTHSGDEPDLLSSLGNPLETTEMDEFIAQDLNLVDVCSPNALHLEQIGYVLDKKPHIYCEKPLGLNLDHARKIVDLAEKAGVLTHTAFTYRYYPAVRQAKSILAAGALGEIFNFRIHYFHNSYMDPLRPMSWRLRKAASGGGALADLGIHIIDMVRFLFGDAAWIRCNTGTFIKERPVKAGSSQMVPVDVDDWAHCMLRLQNGAFGALEVTRLSGGIGDSMRVEIFGSQGSVVFDLSQPDKASYYDQRRKQVLIGEQDFPTPEGERPLNQIMPAHKMTMGYFRDAHTASIYDFLLNIQEGKDSSANFYHATKAQEILEAAYLSADQDGKKIILPLP